MWMKGASGDGDEAEVDDGRGRTVSARRRKKASACRRARELALTREMRRH
jgi:hypothetical protein